MTMRIFVTSGYGYWGAFSPTDLDKGTRQIGGGETAMIQMSRNLARLGHEVVVFYNVERPGKYNGVDYLPTELFVPTVCQMEHDALITWDAPHVLQYADRAKVHVCAFQLNDAMIGIYDHAIDMYLHPSEWHVEYFCGKYPEMTRSKCRARITNGIDLHRYVKEVPRLPHRVIYSASPDRGLHHLLRVWSKILEQVPDATLEVFYEIDNWLAMVDVAFAAHPDVPLNIEINKRALEVRMARENKLPGVTFHGGVGQAQLALEQKASSVMVYPCDPVRPTEGFSMTCLEAVTAGCSLITSDADALKELWSGAPGATVIPLPVDDNVWIEAIVARLKEPRTAKPGEMWAPVDYNWVAVAKRLEGELLTLLGE